MIADARGAASDTGVALPWLVGLRWWALVFQAALILVLVVFFDIPVPAFFAVLIFAFGGLSNAALQAANRRRARVSDEIVTSVLLLDTGLLTLLLFLTGGAMNPFTFLYLIHLVLGAVLLPVRWSWTILVTTIVCYGTLFFPGVDTAGILGAHPPACHIMGEVSGPMLLHLKGMWVAYSITAVCVVFVVGRIRTALARDRQTRRSLADARRRNEMLASLASLSAGATHELSTPLATIAVASAEMIDALREQGASAELLDDAVLIRGQVEQCKGILFQMAADAGEQRGEEERRFTPAQAVDQILDSLGAERRGRVTVDDQTGGLELRLPFRNLCNSLTGLVKNALEASPGQAAVNLTWSIHGHRLHMAVADQGHGMDPEVRSRATEPFFTRKENGLGLGLFLAQTLAERYGGGLDIVSGPATGTTVTMSLDLTKAAAHDRT